MATAARTAPAASGTEHRFLLLLTLSPSSKAIAKGGGGGGGGGGAFRCRTCGRGFATFQALGGHRTSHKRPRVRAAGLDLLLGARPGKGAAAAAAAAHRCHTCGVVFPTGQALGGHMRRHRAALVAALAETMATTTASGVSEQEGDDDDDDEGHFNLIQFL
ncbi:hypothetical protein ACP4OV_002192 [Aristida adscensionis]